MTTDIKVFLAVFIFCCLCSVAALVADHCQKRRVRRFMEQSLVAEGTRQKWPPVTDDAEDGSSHERARR